MSDSIFRRIEASANVAIIAVAALLGVTLTRNYILNDSAPPARTAEVRVGAKLALPGVDWAASERHLVLVLQQGCRFCTESAPFYRKYERRRLCSLRKRGVHLRACWRC